MVPSAIDYVNHLISGTVTSLSPFVLASEGAMNTAPVAEPQDITVDEDTGAAVVLAGSDLESDPLTYAVVTQPRARHSVGHRSEPHLRS